MSEKTPALLVVVIQTALRCWFVAAADLTGKAFPLARSESGDLDAYLELAFDEQTSFLRHKLSGVLQIGCDRLWPKQMKPCEIVFIVDGAFEQDSMELTQRVADHFVEWMTSPPVVFYMLETLFQSDGDLNLKLLAGEENVQNRDTLCQAIPLLRAEFAVEDVWERIPLKKKC